MSTIDVVLWWLLAGAIGAFLGGWGMEMAGYGMICVVAAFPVGLAVLTVALRDRPRRAEI